MQRYLASKASYVGGVARARLGFSFLKISVIASWLNSFLVGLVETKRSLHKHQPDSLPCREKEMKKLSTFICSHLRNDTPGSLYVSGPPGTGKTACLTRVMEKVAGDHLTLSINCISAVRPRMIFQRIAEQLGLKPSKSVVSFQDQLAKYFTTSKKMM